MFTFDHVFDQEATTIQIYRAVARDITSSALDGFNGTIFAYGQTSSGKTHTMYGSKDSPGIIPIAIRDIFSAIESQPTKREYLVRISYMEIYLESVYDLFRKEKQNQNLNIREDFDRNVYVDGLTEHVVTSADQVLKQLATGEENRHIGSTNMNERSSRSHTIFRMTIESRGQDCSIRASTLNLVDLAGSERLGKTRAEGVSKVEGAAINTSLLTLGTVISKLSEGNHSHIPYRDSKLTRILQNSLGGNSRTTIICTITPALVHFEETCSTLKFANRAKKVQNKVHMNEIATEEATQKRYQHEIQRLNQQIADEHQNFEKEREQRLSLLDTLRRQEEQISELNQLVLTAHTRSVETADTGVGNVDSLKVSRVTEKPILTIDSNATITQTIVSSDNKKKKKRRLTWNGTFDTFEQPSLDRSASPLRKRARMADSSTNDSIQCNDSCPTKEPFKSVDDDCTPIDVAAKTDDGADEIEKQTANNERQASEMSQLQQKYDALKADFTALTTQMDQLTEQLNAQMLCNRDVCSERDTLTVTTASLTANVDALTQRNEQLSGEITQLQRERDSLKVESEVLLDGCRSATQRLDSEVMRHNEVCAERDSLLSVTQNLQAELQSLQSTLQSARDMHQSLKELLSQENERVLVLEDTKSKLAHTLEETSQCNRELMEKLEFQQRVNELHKENVDKAVKHAETLEQEKNDMRDQTSAQLNEATKQKVQACAELDKMRVELNQLRQQLGLNADENENCLQLESQKENNTAQRVEKGHALQQQQQQPDNSIGHRDTPADEKVANCIHTSSPPPQKSAYHPLSPENLAPKKRYPIRSIRSRIERSAF